MLQILLAYTLRRCVLCGLLWRRDVAGDRFSICHEQEGHPTCTDCTRRRPSLRGSEALRPNRRVNDRSLRLFGCATWRHFFRDIIDREESAGVFQGLRAAERLINDRITPVADRRWLLNESAETVATMAIARLGRYCPMATGFIDCIFGNPFLRRPAADLPLWLARCPDIARLAAATNDSWDTKSGRFDASLPPVLADAAEDGGCGDVRLLEHLRSDHKHTLGCWAIDTLAGRYDG